MTLALDFGAPPPATAPTLPHNGTETSRAAARSAQDSGQASRQERAILWALKPCYCGLTRKELAADTGIVESTVCARVNRLVAAGLCREEGTRVPEGGSRAQKIVHITEKGKQAL